MANKTQTSISEMGNSFSINMENIISIKNLSPCWKNLLTSEFSKPYMVELNNFLNDELKKGKTLYPNQKDIFNALNLTPLESIKVVILGQDPYHGIHQAHGLAFSVPEDVAIPPSLKNIFTELQNDLGINSPKSGDLTSWAKQGVLLLNTVLTVEDKQPGSHRKKGWEILTDTIIKKVSDLENHIVFILWGSFAQAKASLIDPSKHLILQSVHPSPLSSYRGFFGSSPFSKANQFLIHHKIHPINWKL